MIKRIIITVGIALVFINIIHSLIPWAYYNAGIIAYNKGKFTNAQKLFKNSLIFDSTDKNVRYYYVKTLLKLKPDLSVQKAIFGIANDNKKDSANQLANLKVEEWRTNIALNYGNNYIENTPTAGNIVRWNTKSFPLKIYISNDSEKYLPEYYNEVIFKALNQWKISTGFITYDTVGKYNDADITIIIKSIPKDICKNKKCSYTVGLTTPEYNGNTLKRMNITLYATNPANQFFTDKELYNTMLHELGHAFGIMGHSSNSDDLMYMSSSGNTDYTNFRSSFQYLTSNDINTVKLLYNLKPTITNTTESEDKNLIYAPIVVGNTKEVSKRKLKEAQNYVKNAPEISLGYIDLGIAYLELDNLNEGLKAMKKAHELAKSDNDKYISAYNLALIYLDLNDFKNAKFYCQEAIKISNSDEANNLMKQIEMHKK